MTGLRRKSAATAEPPSRHYLSVLAASETAFVRERQTALGRDVAFDLFGGLDQPLAYQAADLSTMSCGAYQNDLLATPNNLKNVVPNYNRHTLADELRVSTIGVCLCSDGSDHNRRL